MCSVSESQEASDASSNPYVLFFSAWNLHEETEVGGVARGRQGSCTREYLVYGTVVDACFWDFTVLLRQEPDQWEFLEELLWLGIIEVVAR